jgi:osmotically-inducible protein OsmY
MLKTDEELRDAVTHELNWETRLCEHTISVRVERRVTVLEGTVASWAERLIAGEAAQRVVGVHDVVNRLEVRLSIAETCSDSALMQAVRTALDWDVFIPKGRIRSGVNDGKVVLEGHVDFCSQRDDAGRAVRNIRGVRCVLNRIEVKPPADNPHLVQKAIEAALERRAERKARGINLDVHDGKVILSGVVHSWAERQSVVGAAKGTPGVRSVDDRLSVEP